MKNKKIIAVVMSLVITAGSISFPALCSAAEEEITYTIVGSTEVDVVANKISNESPIGAALLGAKKNQTVEANTPGGILKFKVLAITK